MEFLEHATEAIRAALGGRTSVLFVPFAGSDQDAYANVMRKALARIDVQVTRMHEVSDTAGRSGMPKRSSSVAGTRFGCCGP
jgi:peptidase E